MLDLCYTDTKASKQFAWDICGEMFMENLLQKNGYQISYPIPDDAGEIEFNGMHFSMHTVCLHDMPQAAHTKEQEMEDLT